MISAVHTVFMTIGTKSVLRCITITACIDLTTKLSVFQNNDACIDLQGEPIKSREQLAAPDGWEWTQDWVIDNNRAVDENGMLSQMIFYLPN